MARNLEARIAALEEQRGANLLGLEGGRLAAKLCYYEGDALEAKARELSGLPARRHEEWIDLMNDPITADVMLRGPEREIAMMRLKFGAGYAMNLGIETVKAVLSDPLWSAFTKRIEDSIGSEERERRAKSKRDAESSYEKRAKRSQEAQAG